MKGSGLGGKVDDWFAIDLITRDSGHLFEHTGHFMALRGL